MQKTCTNSACRRKFSTVSFSDSCPWCGKLYPRIHAPAMYTAKYLKLYDYGRNWMVCTKVVRNVSEDLGLAGSKRLVMSIAPGKPITVEIAKPEIMAEETAKLTAIGAHFEVKKRKIARRKSKIS